MRHSFLLSLALLAGCNSYVVTPDEALRSDIQNLNEAVMAWQEFFKAARLPSRIRLTPKLADMDDKSLAVLRQMYPDPAFLTTWGRDGMVWSDRATGPVVLEGDQCLVFFLGGPQRKGMPIGWSRNPANPTDAGGGRIILYEFPTQELRARPGQVFLSFFDRHGQQPYAYFSDQATNADCQTLGVFPYGRVAGFQIISAGRDGQFGAKGDAWSPTNAALTYPANSAGADDRANFHRHRLGQPE